MIGLEAIGIAIPLLHVLLSALPAIAARQHLSSLTPRRSGVRVPNYQSPRRFMAAFGHPKYFTDKYIPANEPGVVLKVPKFDVLFDELCKISPLAKQALTEPNPGGIKAINSSDDSYKWKVTDNNPKRLVSHIDKIDNFQNNGVPLLRFRSSLTGPSKQRGLCFSELVSTTDLRQKWDATNAFVDTIYSAASLSEVKKLQEGKYGEPKLFGIGFVKTKQSIVSPREQLTLCGLQNFPSGASIIWGVELEEDQNHLFPKDTTNRRLPRSTSHIFATTLIPTDGNGTSFDVEYCIQLEVGGLPGWLIGPAVTETVKKMFRFADGYFKSGLNGGDLAKRLAQIPDNGDNDDVYGDSKNNDEGKDPGELLSESSATAVLDHEQTLLMPP
mmetsp:Transcript_38996/g.81988  ORF Transcript_38996/g.81988 Transcript_38996/m.81988 type:complete len:385 (+) Transcript_38996:91-1245(+)|eukprot:CAMPEP_0183727044 /NCGR_PEP_ID=MMETSP0737-20130205/24675_1 /TAXON_ID=385413 /ORGANISM="Thalassiosira miniscula, Strain CCMP1093" /LENGTH=384 /DNA_ID=CAMNT_0025958567 /DNA_START=52 /DNA_END=1206 /DNA_ORIENTATION=-